MNKLINKKMNNHGVSILFALLLFLVVSMVSITIIASSSTSVKRTVSMNDTLQENINLDSAIKLAKLEVNNKKYSNYEWFYNSDSYFSTLLTSVKSNYLSWNENRNRKATDKGYDNNAYYVITTTVDELSDVSIFYRYHFEDDNSYLVLKLVPSDINNVAYIKFFITPDTTDVFRISYIIYTFSEVRNEDF